MAIFFIFLRIKVGKRYTALECVIAVAQIIITRFMRSNSMKRKKNQHIIQKIIGTVIETHPHASSSSSFVFKKAHFFLEIHNRVSIYECGYFGEIIYINLNFW